jgi:hypothetical protein
MIIDYSKTKVMWTKHATAEVIEDNFKAEEIERNLNHVVEFPESEGDKMRGIIRVGVRYCTLIYVTTNNILKVITCWESNSADIEEYKRANKNG